MNKLFEKNINCPYCGDLITVFIDCSVDEQEYIEDCQVCCRLINFKVQLTGDCDPLVSVFDENEV